MNIVADALIDIRAKVIFHTFKGHRVPICIVLENGEVVNKI